MLKQEWNWRHNVSTVELKNYKIYWQQAIQWWPPASAMINCSEGSINQMFSYSAEKALCRVSQPSESVCSWFPRHHSKNASNKESFFKLTPTEMGQPHEKLCQRLGNDKLRKLDYKYKNLGNQKESDAMSSLKTCGQGLLIPDLMGHMIVLSSLSEIWCIRTLGTRWQYYSGSLLNLSDLGPS